MRKLVLAFCLVFVSASLFATCNPPAGKLVLVVSGLKGSSSACRDGIDLSSARIVLSGTAKGGAGKITVSKAIDSSTPALLEKMAEQSHLNTISLYVPASNGKTDQYTMTDLLISSFRQTASPASETLTVDFTRFAGTKNEAPTSEKPGGIVEVTGPGPYSFVGSTSPAAVQLSMTLESQEVKINALTVAASARKGKIDMQMTVTTSVRDLQADSMSRGEKRYNSATVTLKNGSTVVASYLLKDVSVRVAGNQTSVEFAKIEFKYGSGSASPGTAGQGRFGWDIKANNKV